MTRYCLQCGGAITLLNWPPEFCGPCALDRTFNNGRLRCASLVAKAIREGTLRHPREFACADCGRPATEYDHRDYNAPLAVDPVCCRCNSRRGPGKWVPRADGKPWAPSRRWSKLDRAARGVTHRRS